MIVKASSLMRTSFSAYFKELFNQAIACSAIDALGHNGRNVFNKDKPFRRVGAFDN